MESEFRIDVLGPGGTFRSRTPEIVTGLHGEDLARLSLAPTVYIDRAMRSVRRAPDLPGGDRAAALSRAAQIFQDGTPDGLSVGDYQDRVIAVSGLPRSVVESSTHRIVAACAGSSESALLARPAGASLVTRQAADYQGGVWVRRGRTFAVLAAGNHPAVHANWLEALALGYRVIVRPSRREPFTANRLVRALREAGFPDDHVVLLPSGHAETDAIVNGADLSMVYGGDEVVARYAGNPSVLPQGPGRAKVLIPSSVNPLDQIELVIDSVTRHAGVSCTCATSVYIDGDVAAFATELGARLAKLPSRQPDLTDAVLPVVAADRARQLSGHLAAVADGARPILGAERVVDELGDGTAVLRPAVHIVASADDPRTRVELPFPCVWVAPWSPADGLSTLADTLILTIADSAARELAEEALQEPTIRNVYLGSVPTSWSGRGLPHDDYLGSFLMESKSLVAGP